MAVSVIDGTIEAASKRSTKRKYALYDSLDIRGRDGSSHNLKNILAAGEVAAALTPGASGRFYVSEGLGQKGIHGARLDDGRAFYDHFNNMELMFMIGALAGGFMLIVGLAGLSEFKITPVVLGLFLAAGWFVSRNARLEGRRQFDQDTACVAAS
jgi:hypothetical protein